MNSRHQDRGWHICCEMWPLERGPCARGAEITHFAFVQTLFEIAMRHLSKDDKQVVWNSGEEVRTRDIGLKVHSTKILLQVTGADEILGGKQPEIEERSVQLRLCSGALHPSKLRKQDSFSKRNLKRAGRDGGRKSKWKRAQLSVGMRRRQWAEKVCKGFLECLLQAFCIRPLSTFNTSPQRPGSSSMTTAQAFSVLRKTQSGGEETDQ